MIIFICYRRQDTVGLAGRLHDRLVAKYGSDSVFMDIDAIPLGIDFRAEISNQVSQANFFLALMGPNWLELGDLGNPADYVRIEIEAALRRNIPVIPLLIGHDRVPLMSQLPECLADLAFRNAMRLDPGREFHSNVDGLIRALDRQQLARLNQLAAATARKSEPPSENKHLLVVEAASRADQLRRWIQEVKSQAGRWLPDNTDLETAPSAFEGFFVCLMGSDFVGKGAIVRGNRWDKSQSPEFQVIYGYCKGPSGAKWHIAKHKLSHLGSVWREEFSDLSKAIFADNGKKLESFTNAATDA